MKTVFLLFDSVNRLMLEPYGGQLLETPNFKRLAERSVTFDNHYIGSMPCMPARRDMQTGHLSFLHRSWGPLEPFDNSFPELLKTAGAYSHLISDHYHYWEDGGATYHTRYNSFEFIRGQESDPWKVLLDSPIERIRARYHPSQNDPNSRQNPYNYMINREFIKEEKDFPSVQCFDSAFDFLDRNRGADNWLLQVETFDPHEPFFAPERLKAKFPTDYDGPILDWPRYERVSEPQDQIDELRANYFALLTLCDELLGRMLDYFDEHDLWKDTALILTTDHGFLLGEHDWWAKNRMPLYEEISHIPLFVHHPAFAGQAGTRRSSLTQTIDLMPTFCELFGAEIPAEVQGKSLLPLLAADEAAARRRDLRLLGRRHQRGGRSLHLVLLPARHEEPGPLPVHADARAHDQALHRRGAPQRQPRPPLRLDQGRAAAPDRPPLQGRPAHPQLPLPRGDGGHQHRPLRPRVRSGPGDADPRPGGGSPPPRRPLPPDARRTTPRRRWSGACRKASAPDQTRRRRKRAG